MRHGGEKTLDELQVRSVEHDGALEVDQGGDLGDCGSG